MPLSHNPVPLRTLLLVDAATCLAMGGCLVLGAGFIASLTQIPSDLLFYAGLALFRIAAFMAIAATRPAISTAAVWMIVLGNLLWVLGSLLILTGGWIAPNALGYSFVAAQALVVAILAWLEHGASRADRIAAQAA